MGLGLGLVLALALGSLSYKWSSSVYSIGTRGIYSYVRSILWVYEYILIKKDVFFVRYVFTCIIRNIIRV